MKASPKMLDLYGFIATLCLGHYVFQEINREIRSGIEKSTGC